MDRYIELDKLIKYPKNSHYRGINWKDNINKTLRFKYGEIEGELTIINYDSNTRILQVEYNNKINEITTNSFKNCSLGRILGVITKEFKLDVGKTLKDNKRDMTIIDREYRKRGRINDKWYKYRCNKCGWDEGWIVESSLLNCNAGCSCCNGAITVKGINDIATTDPWMIKYLVDSEDAYKYTHSSAKKVKVKCPYCGRVKDKSITPNKLHTRQAVSCSCNDGISYPNKLMFNLLEQLGVEFEKEYSPDWIGNRKYDFYIPSMKLIIEMDGGLGHGKKIHSKSLVSKRESILIDDLKDSAALNKGIDVVRVNCNYTTVMGRLSYIKNNILNSKLIKYFDFNEVDWDKADEFALKNIVKEVCIYYEQNKPEINLHDISRKYKISNCTIRTYLKIGNKFGWCNYVLRTDKKIIYEVCEYYNSNKNLLLSDIAKKFNLTRGTISRYIRVGSEIGLCEYDPHKIRVNASNKKKVRVIELDEMFISASECSRVLTERFGCNFDGNCISKICNGLNKNRKTHRGFHFEYVEDN